ncbi:MAG: protein kinase [Planctomycetes bacterium]|nr:protein kinase [Planctomycetota bacterium]MCB9890450.1 protein kinase [Planctomycetota bacterium]MCB9917691.1 protein kinase [Planctomycetota bacterium]
MSSRNEQIDSILERCFASDPSRFEAEVREACLAHPELAPAIEVRLEKLRRIGFLEAHEPRGIDALRFEDFTLHEVLGRGGMGVVHRATQTSLGRDVALKLIRPEFLFFEGAHQRFHREIVAISKLQHRNIVPVLASGETSDTPWFAMELLRGASLRDLLDELAKQSPQDTTAADYGAALLTRARATEEVRGDAFTGTRIQCAIRIVRDVANALEHAHGRGVVHRDVKPSNISVEPDGTIRLFDFGLARSGDIDARMTQDPGTLGSLHYMPPEALRGEINSPERGDVWALGVILYELLTHRRPFESKDRESLRHSILAATPPRPRESDRAIPVDVETVCATALDPSETRRYASASDFARDLDHLLAHRPIEARPPGRALRVRRWIQRHPTMSVAMLLGFFLFVVAPLVTISQVLRERNAAIAERDRADRIGYSAGLLAADTSTRNSEISVAKAFLSGCAADLRDFEWRHLSALVDSRSGRLAIPERAFDLRAVDARTVAFVDGGDTIRLVGVPNIESRSELQIENASLTAISSVPDEHGDIELIVGDSQGAIHVVPRTINGTSRYMLRTGTTPIRRIVTDPKSPSRIGVLAATLLDDFGPEGSTLYVFERNDDQWASVASRSFPGTAARSVVFDPDHDRLYFDRDNDILLWDYRAEGAPGLLCRSSHRIKTLDVLPRERRLLVARQAATILAIDLDQPDDVRSLTSHDAQVVDLCVDGDGLSFVSASWDKTVTLWNDQSDATPRRLRGSNESLDTAALCGAFVVATSSRIVAGEGEPALHIWRRSAAPSATFTLARPVARLAFDAKRSILYAGGYDGLIRAFDIDGNRLLFSLSHGRPPTALIDDSEALHAVDANGTWTTWQDGKEIRRLQLDHGITALVHCATASNKGSFLAGTSDGRLIKFDPDGKPTASLELGASLVRCIVESPSQDTYCATDDAGDVHLIASDTLERRFSFRALEARAFAAAWSSDGSRLFVAGKDRRIVCHSAQNGRQLGVLHGHDGGVHDLVMNPAGTRLFSAGAGDFSVRIWNPENFELLFTIRGHGSAILDLAIDREGYRIATGDMRGLVRVVSDH